MNVKDKVFVVTGGGNGIGRQVVLSLLSKGGHVAALDIKNAALKETSKLAGENQERLSTHVCDISKREAVEKVFEEILTHHKAVDGLLNVAGIIQPFIDINDLSYEKIEQVMNVNFYGTLYMVKTFLPHLLSRPEGHIVNISSMGGFLPVPGQSIYGASKAAVKLMTEALYSELRNTNVHVTVVFPGGVGTDIMKNSGAEGTRKPKENASKKEQAYKVLSPEDAAEIIIKGMIKNKFRVLAGKDAIMMDRLYRLMPKKATEIIAKKL